MAVKYLLLAVLMFVSAYAQTEPSLKDALDKLPPELQGKVNEDQIKDIQNKSTVVFKDKCMKNGGPDAFPNAENAFGDFKTCVKNLVNFTVLNEEIEAAKPTGQVDEVFKKYCAKTPLFKGCFRNATEAVKPCFSAEEKKNLKTVYNVSEQLAEFVCFKEGDRIALFIAENGPECFQDHTDDIQACINQTFGSDHNINPNNLTADSIPKINFGEKECNQLNQLQKCVVSSLEKCEQPTSANIVESLFKFARSATPCRDFPIPSEKKPNSASGLAVTSATIFIAVTTLFV